MTQHASNIAAFVRAASSSSDNIIRAYCGLVAIELVLKHATGLKDHNVPAALNKFAHLHAVGHLAGCKIRLTTLSTQIANALKVITVQGIDGAARFAPPDIYPYIRYTRFDVDGWSAPSTTDEQAQALSALVEATRSYLHQKFNHALVLT